MNTIVEFPNEEGFNLLEEVFEALDDINGNEDISGYELLAEILQTPDEKFALIAPALLDSFEVTFNAPDAQIAFAQMLNTQGIHLEDLNASFDLLSQAIDSNEVEYSQLKKDFLKSMFGLFINSINNSNGVSKRIIQIPIELCRENAKLPTYATIGSAAMDLYSPEEYTIAPGETKLIPLGIKVNIPRGYALLIQPRSGMSVKTKLRVANTPGLIDSDYHEEIGLIIENIDDSIKDCNIEDISDGEGSLFTHKEIVSLYGSNYTIGKGERCAQMRLVEVPQVNWIQVDSIGEFDNDHGKGFGSTGKL